MKKNILLALSAILVLSGCAGSLNKPIHKVGVITKVKNNVMYITLENGLPIKLAAVSGEEEVGDVVKLEIK